MRDYCLPSTLRINCRPLQAAIRTQLTSAQVANLNSISARYRSDLSRCLRGLKCDEMTLKADRNRCPWAADLNRLITDRARN